jgi:signal transduction histidine kinase/ActR/RegA family two-component response regulator
MPAAASTAPFPPANDPPRRGPAIEDRARVELVRLAYRELKDGTLASGATAVGFALAVGFEMPTTGLWVWLGVMLAISGYRLWLAAAFHRVELAAAAVPRWALRYVSGTTAAGLGWGASVWLFPTLEQNGTLGIVHVLILAGLTTGAARLLLPLRPGSVTYLLAVMAPLALKFFAQADVSGVVAGLCVTAFVVYMIRAADRIHRALAEAIVTRLEREALAVQLQAQNQQRESREAELRDARERAELASRAKGDFLATLSHEIRTPMNGVLGMLRIVRDTPLTADQRDYVKTATDSAETLLLLLNDVLDFARIEAGRLELQPAPFPPATAARAVAEIMHTRARDKGLQFNLQIDDNVPHTVVGDAGRVRQILVALIGNAIKFTERGRVDLTVACVERTEARAVLHFTVSDTGIGIDSASLERLFKPFTQADTSLGRRYGGTGLGLAISTRLAQAMGGLIQVQSTLNQGTTFRLILPCSVPDVVTAPATAEAPRATTPTLHGRVLVVEDDSVNRQVMELFLKKMRVATKFAPDGDTAIRLATSETFDVILMDCQLPGIDGLETTRRIRRKLEGGRPVKIIALTANAGRSFRDSCLAAGMDDFVTKPVRLEILVDVLQRTLPRDA